jgi:hypothetical protein
VTGGRGSDVTFEQAKKAMENFIYTHFRGLPDDKLRVVLKVGEVQGASAEGIGNHFDYVRMLDVFKSRHAGP